MIDRLMHHASRMALSLQIVFGALLACAGADEARAFKVDPLWAAGQAALLSPAVHPAATVTDKIPPLPRHRPDDLTAADTSPAISGNLRELRGLKITPASASWKVKGLKRPLVKLLIKVQLHFGRPLHIISGCRSKAHNRRVGGARRSQHLHCNAADFQIKGVSKHKLAAYLKRMPGRGGVGVYCRSSYVHLDVGPKRQWYWSCGKRKKYKKRRARRKVARSGKKRSTRNTRIAKRD